MTYCHRKISDAAMVLPIGTFRLVPLKTSVLSGTAYGYCFQSEDPSQIPTYAKSDVEQKDCVSRGYTHAAMIASNPMDQSMYSNF